jgi:hypothetical protein
MARIWREYVLMLFISYGSMSDAIKLGVAMLLLGAAAKSAQTGETPAAAGFVALAYLLLREK